MHLVKSIDMAHCCRSSNDGHAVDALSRSAHGCPCAARYRGCSRNCAGRHFSQDAAFLQLVLTRDLMIRGSTSAAASSPAERVGRSWTTCAPAPQYIAFCGAQRADIHARLCRQHSGLLATVTQAATSPPNRRSRARRRPGFQSRPPSTSILTTSPVVNCELPAVAGESKRGVVPGQLGQRIGAFLQPTVVGKPSVVDARVQRQGNFKCIIRGGLHHRRQALASETSSRFALPPIRVTPRWR